MIGIFEMDCNNCKFLKILRGGVLPEVRLVAGLDIDKELLEDNVKYLRPLPGDWLDRREKPFTLELYHGSCGSENGAKVLSGRVQAVTAIELIEHLDPDTLNTFPSTVLGVLSPLVWIVTTPNREFNVLFLQFIGPFRHWDHKFEWTRMEFKSWAFEVVKKFPEYNVEFLGVGFKEGFEERHGPASQVAIFKKSRENVMREERAESDCLSDWVRIERFNYPVKIEETRSHEDVLGDELVYYLRLLTWDRSTEEVKVDISDLLVFESVRKLTRDNEVAARLLRLRGLNVDTEKMTVEAEKQEMSYDLEDLV